MTTVYDIRRMAQERQRDNDKKVTITVDATLTDADLPLDDVSQANDPIIISDTDKKLHGDVAPDWYTGRYDVDLVKSYMKNIGDNAAAHIPLHDMFLIMAKIVELITGDHFFFRMMESYWEFIDEDLTTCK